MIKTGKNVKYISAQTYVGTVDESTFTSSSVLTLDIDPIRYYSKNFWTQHENKFIKASDINNNKLFDIEYLDNNEILLKADSSKFSTIAINKKGLLEKKFDVVSWEYFIRDIVYESQTYQDYSVDFQEPINVSDDVTDNNTNYIKKQFVYNFYCDKYENLLKNKLFNESIIPGSSQFAEANINPNNESNKNLHILFGGTLSASLGDTFIHSKQYTDNLKDYFNTFLESYNRDAYGIAYNQISQNNFNIQYDNTYNNFIKNLNYVPYPMYCDIYFSSAVKNNDISKKIYTTGDIYKYFYQYFLNNEPHSNTIFLKNSNIVENIVLNEYDVKLLINEDIQGLRNPGTADNVRIYGQGDVFYKNVEYANLLKYFKNEVSPSIRSFKDITNKSCKYDILMYKLEKRNKNENAILQTIWINPNDTDYIRYIDTHIKYGEEYNYTLKAYTIIVGNSYSYKKYDYTNKELKRVTDLKNGYYRFIVDNKASYKIVEIPVAKFYGLVQEKPYSKPIYNIKKYNDGIKFTILDDISNNLEEHEIVENEDFDKFEMIKISQNREKMIASTASNIRPIQLEIYKTTIRPTSYISFQGKKYKTLILNNKNSFEDTIIPNIKYYYLLRYVNTHGVPSNVSKVYELMMKEEDGYLYLLSDEVDFSPSKEVIDKKDFKRYLLLRPSLIQTFPRNINNPYGIYGVEMGPDKEPVWEKDFIVRIKSKKTNRIIEFNLKSKINRKKD